MMAATNASYVSRGVLYNEETPVPGLPRVVQFYGASGYYYVVVEDCNIWRVRNMIATQVTNDNDVVAVCRYARSKSRIIALLKSGKIAIVDAKQNTITLVISLGSEVVKIGTRLILTESGKVYKMANFEASLIPYPFNVTDCSMGQKIYVTGYDEGGEKQMIHHHNIDPNTIFGFGIESCWTSDGRIWTDYEFYPRITNLPEPENVVHVCAMLVHTLVLYQNNTIVVYEHSEEKVRMNNIDCISGYIPRISYNTKSARSHAE